jgi:hypothetical protein
VFAVHACGFKAALALRDTGSERLRLERLVELIRQSRFGIHDLSRVRPTERDGLPRFNMPFECGVFFGALRFGSPAQRRKRFLLLDSEPYRYQRTLSDAAGLDPRAHRDDPAQAISCVRYFLADAGTERPIGAAAIRTLYRNFQADLPTIAARAKLEPSELEPLEAFNDWHLLAARWLQDRARSGRVVEPLSAR